MSLATHIRFLCYGDKMMNAWNSKTADMPAISSIISSSLCLSMSDESMYEHIMAYLP